MASDLAAAGQKRVSEGQAWLRENLVFQSISGTVFGTALVGWIALGAVGAALLASAAAACIVLPIIGWFIGLPLVFVFAFAGAMLWIMGAVAIFAAWGITTAAVAFVTFARRRPDTH